MADFRSLVAACWYCDKLVGPPGALERGDQERCCSATAKLSCPWLEGPAESRQQLTQWVQLSPAYRHIRLASKARGVDGGSRGSNQLVTIPTSSHQGSEVGHRAGTWPGQSQLQQCRTRFFLRVSSTRLRI